MLRFHRSGIRFNCSICLVNSILVEKFRVISIYLAVLILSIDKTNTNERSLICLADVCKCPDPELGIIDVGLRIFMTI